MNINNSNNNDSHEISKSNRNKSNNSDITNDNNMDCEKKQMVFILGQNMLKYINGYELSS